jgi:hypothetical protein
MDKEALKQQVDSSLNALWEHGFECGKNQLTIRDKNTTNRLRELSSMLRDVAVKCSDADLVNDIHNIATTIYNITIALRSLRLMYIAQPKQRNNNYPPGGSIQSWLCDMLSGGLILRLERLL